MHLGVDLFHIGITDSLDRIIRLFLHQYGIK